MDKIETLTTELEQKKQSLLQELQNYIYPDTNIENIAKCIKGLHEISISLLKVDLFKDTHEDLQLHDIYEYKEKTLEDILYSAIEEPFPKTLKIMTALRSLLPRYYKDLLLRAFEGNEFKEITYLLPPGNLLQQGNSKGNSQSILRQELWSTLKKDNPEEYKREHSLIYAEDIVEYLSGIGERDSVLPVLKILKEDSTIEIIEKKEWENFIREITDLKKGEFFAELAESLYQESGDIKAALKILEDAFFREYSLDTLREKIILYSIACLMIFKVGIITTDLKDLRTLKDASLIDHLFETTLQYKPKQLLLLKQNLKSIYSLYSTEEALNKLFEEFLLSQSVRTFNIFLTLDQKHIDKINQLLIEDENKLFDLVYKFIHQNCYFEHYEFINKMVKLLKNTLTLETRLRFIEDIEKLEFDAECVELMFNFNVNHKFSSLEEFEELDKLAKSRERGLEILSQIVTNFNRNYIRFAHVTLKGKPIDLKSARSVLNVLLHLQEHVMKKCINISLVYQVFVKKLLEFGNTRDVQQLIDRENLLDTISREIFEMIVVEVVATMLDKLPNLSMLDEDLTHKIKKCFDLIPWNSEIKDAEKALYKICLQLKDTELYTLSPSHIRSCNKIELLKQIVKSSSKVFEKASYVELYSQLRQIEFKSIDGDKEFIAFMADFIDSYLQNNDKRKVDDLIDYLNENDYEKISEVLIKILKEKTIAVKNKDKEYYMKLGVLKCKDPNLLVEYFKDDSVPFLKDLNKDVYTDSPASMKIILADFDLLTAEVYRKRQEFDTTWNMKAFLIDIFKKINVNRQWNDELYFFLTNLNLNHQRAFAFLAQAPGITINIFDTIMEMMVKSSYFNIEKTCSFFLNYVLPDNLKYNIYSKEQASPLYKQYGSAADFQRVIEKYQALQAYGKDFTTFQSLVDWKDQVKFVYDQDFRKDIISKMIVVAHSDPEIVDKAHKYGLEVNFISQRMLESTFYSLTDKNLNESLVIIKESLEKIPLNSSEEQKNFIKSLRDIYEKSESIKYLPELLNLVSEKIPNNNPFNSANIKLLQALISVNLEDKLKPFINFNIFLTSEFQSSLFDKMLDFGRMKEVVKKEVDQGNVFILAKCLPDLVPHSLTPEDIQSTMLLNLICEDNILWSKTNLNRLTEGRISENNEAKLYIDRIDMLLNQMSSKLLLAVLKEIMYINMEIAGVPHKEDANLPLFTKLSLNYQQFFIEKIMKKLGEKSPDETNKKEEIGMSQVVKVKLRLLNQLEGLYQSDMAKVLPLKEFMMIRTPNRLSNFIFGLFNKEVISSPMLVSLIKELGKEAFIKGYLKAELSAKLEETSIEISDRLWDVWDKAITFKKILSTNRHEKTNFVVNLEKIENDNQREFEPLIRFLQKTNELFILDEEFAQETRDSLAQVIISTVIENSNYQFRLKLMLLYISFKYMSEISVSNNQRNTNITFEIFALLDKGFNEFESMFQFGKFLLDVLLSDSPGIYLIQLFDSLVFAPKEKLFYQNIILRDIALRLPSDDLIRHCIDNLINFNCHESSEMIFDLFFVRRTKAVTVDRETSTKNILNLVLEEMAYKVDRKTKHKIEENLQNLIKPLTPGSKGAQLIYKYLIYKARMSILQKTDHYEPCLEFAKDMFRAFSNKQEISEDFEIDEVLDYNEDIHQICIYELWAGKTLEYILLKNIVDLVESGEDLEAANLVTEYLKEVKLEEGPSAEDKAYANLKTYLEGIIREEKVVYKKIQPILKATLDQIKS